MRIECIVFKTKKQKLEQSNLDKVNRREGEKNETMRKQGK
jgi:hypothetical protein